MKSPARFLLVPIVFIALILIAGRPAVAQTLPAAAGHETLTPWLENETCLIVRLELARLDIPALFTEVDGVIGQFQLSQEESSQAAMAIAGVKTMLEGYVTMFRNAGAREICLIMSSIEMPQMYLVVTLEPGRDGSALYPVLNMLTPKQKTEFQMFFNFETIRQEGNAVFAGTDSTFQRLRNPDKGVPAELSQAWPTVQNGGLAALVFLTQDIQRVLRESNPSFPIGNQLITGGGIADSLRWATLKVTLPPGLKIDYLVQTKDDAAALKWHDLIHAGRKEFLAGGTVPAEQVPALEKLLAAVIPTVDGSRLNRQLEAQTAISMLAPMIELERNKARSLASMTNIKQLLLGIIMFKDANQNQLPPTLASLTEKGLVTAEILTSPLGKQSSGYHYRGADLGGKATDPALILIIEKIAGANPTYLIGFFDGHVEKIAGDTSYLPIIANDNLLREKLGLSQKPPF